MSQTETQMTNDPFTDHLVITHPDGNVERFPTPVGEAIVRIGRELDNDIILTDPRASRYHAEVRQVGQVLEIKDLNSANGVLINEKKTEPETWTPFTSHQSLKLAETLLVWEKAKSSQSTVVMARQRRDDTKVSQVPPREHKPAPVVEEKKPAPMLPIVLGVGVVVALLVFVSVLMLYGLPGRSGEATSQPVAAVTASPEAGRGEGNLNQQSTSVEPTATPTPSGPQLAIPVVELTKFQVSPIIFGASPSTNSAYLFINVRVRNAGNIPFIFSISNFSLKDRRSGKVFTEAGANTSESYLKQLGAIDRFKNLALTPGGSVPGSLVFELEINSYDPELVFDAPDVSPVVISPGAVNMRRELDLAAGTPLAALNSDQENQATATPTVAPTPTATRPPEIPSPVVVSRSALKGTIAYPNYDGQKFDVYLGDVASGKTRFFHTQASQPAFNNDGSRLAIHSWDNNSRGLVTIGVDGSNPKLVANFVEDQLPTWTADGTDVIFLTRRTGDRKSNLRVVDSNTEKTEGDILGEGEYPAIGANGNMVFKGWGVNAYGLRTSTAKMDDIKTVTNAEADTAPALSPDGSKIVFMSKREDNWDIYVTNADGSGLNRLTTDPARDGLPVWSPDGNAIAFVSDRGGVWAVWVMTPDGKGVSQLFTMSGTPDGFVGNDTYASRGWAEEHISWTASELVK